MANLIESFSDEEQNVSFLESTDEKTIQEILFESHKNETYYSDNGIFYLRNYVLHTHANNDSSYVLAVDLFR